jgi:DNA modification methylase
VGFGGKSSTKSHTEIYLIFHLKVRVSHLWVAPYNEYQHFLFETITDFREKGWNFQQIADWLNENDYSTATGKRFRNAHAHSIVKKKKSRDVRETDSPQEKQIKLQRVLDKLEKILRDGLYGLISLP